MSEPERLKMSERSEPAPSAPVPVPVFVFVFVFVFAAAFVLALCYTGWMYPVCLSNYNIRVSLQV